MQTVNKKFGLYVDLRVRALRGPAMEYEFRKLNHHHHHIIIRFLKWPKQLKTITRTTVYGEHDGQVNGGYR